MRYRYLLIIITGSLLLGCLPTPRVPQKRDAVIVSKSLAYAEPYWRDEVGRRFTNALIVIGHGAVVDGIWCIVPMDESGKRELVPIPVKWMVQRLRDEYPDRPIVLVICNEAGDKTLLSEPNTWFALSRVWTVPSRWQYHGPPLPYSVGSIDEFVGSP